MKAAFSAIWNALWLLIAAGVFLFVMWTYARAHSAMWRRVSDRYKGHSPTPRTARKVPDTIIITGRGTTGPLVTGNIAYRLYPGTVIAVHEDGIELSLMPLFNIMCPPIFLPFDEMELKQTTWALWREPMALRMKRLPGEDIIFARDTIQWIRSHTQRSPFGLGV